MLASLCAGCSSILRGGRVGGAGKFLPAAGVARRPVALRAAPGGRGALFSAETDVSDAPRVPATFQPWPFAYHEEIVVKIESLTNMGYGIGRVALSQSCLELQDAAEAAAEEALKGLSSSQRRRRRRKKSQERTSAMEQATLRAVDDLEAGAGGAQWVVQVPFAIPGETVRAKVYRNRKRYSEADLVDVVEPSADRTEPECPLFSQCGGCQYQHMSLPAQREAKRQQVSELLERLGGLELPEGVVVEAPLGTAEAYGYRSKLTPHFEPPAKTAAGEITAIGFKSGRGRFIIDVAECAIATPAINAAMGGAREAARAEARERFGAGKKAKGGTLLLRDTPSHGVVTDPLQVVSERVRHLDLQFRAGDFFQNNPYVLPLMVEHVLQEATAPSTPGGADRPRFLVDAYCGGGLFALSAAELFEEVIGVEVSEGSVASAKENAERNGIENCDFTANDSAAIFKRIPEHFLPRETAMIIDPPRKGCDEPFLRQLLEFRPRRLVYVSCDPSTQARDAKFILADGAYRVTRVRPVDLFPQTRHIENVMSFERVA